MTSFEPDELLRSTDAAQRFLREQMTPYPAGEGRAAILRSVAPKRRRVRRLCARSNQ